MAKVIDADFLEEAEKAEEPKKESKTGRQPFHVWMVGGEQYKLILNADATIMVEKALGGSLFETISSMPPLSTMLSIVQAAMQRYHHGVGKERVKKLYDMWIEEDENNNLIDFYKKIIIPVMAASGFFPKDQANQFLEDLESV